MGSSVGKPTKTLKKRSKSIVAKVPRDRKAMLYDIEQE